MKNTTQIKVAGVTFKNDINDGGKSRQDVLADILSKGYSIITVKLKHVAYQDKTTGIYELAIKCIEKRSGQVIGFIPKTAIESMKTQTELTGFINLYKNTYYVNLTPQQKPSPTQYRYVKDLCDKYGWTQPAYDVAAYNGFIAAIKKSNAQPNLNCAKSN